MDAAIKEMLQNDVWSPVVEKLGLPKGVATEHDVLRKCVGRASSQMMSSPLITIDPDAAVGDAMTLMVEKNIRRLFVVEKGKIAGRVTQTGLFERMLAVMTDLSSVAGQL